MTYHEEGIMKRYIFLFQIVALAVCVVGCGDNKAKEKVINGGLLNGDSYTTTAASTPASYSGNVAVNSAGMISRMGSGMGKAGMFAPSFVAQRVAGMNGPDSDGFYKYNDLGSDFRIKFMNASGATLNPDSAQMAAFTQLEVKIKSLYQYGTFDGDFIIDASLNSNTETVKTGTITSSDPVGGTFTATGYREEEGPDPQRLDA